MSVLASRVPNVQPRAMEGIGCIVLGMLLFAAQDGMMKSLLGVYPIWMLIAVRGVLAIAILGPIDLILRGPHRVFSPLWPLHLLRAVLFAVGFSCFYAAFPFMGLAEVSTIFFSAPLIIALLASVWLGERIGRYRVSALIAGFIGVLIAMNPTSDAFHWVALLPLICAATYAVSQIVARQIGDRETTLTTGLYTIVFSSVLMGIAGWVVNQSYALGPEFNHLRWEWPAPSTHEALMLALLGSVGMTGYMLLSRAYQVTSASIVAPFDYSYLPFAIVIAYIFWEETPSDSTILGMALIVSSGLYIGYRELRSARRQVEPPFVAEAVITPGSPLEPMSLGTELQNAHETDRQIIH